MATNELTLDVSKGPINLTSKDFINHKYLYYKWLRDHSPVHKGKLSVLTMYFLSHYEDCVNILKDPRIVRNRTTATGGGRFPIPMPKSVTIPKGKPIMPLLGAANHDPAVFEDPEVFDVARTPNRHLGFGQGIHYCLGAPLARIETKIALKNLLARSPNLRLAVAPDALKLQNIPGWHRYESLPVVMG